MYVVLMTLNRRLQDTQEGDGALGMALEDVDNEADHGGNCYFVWGDSGEVWDDEGDEEEEDLVEQHDEEEEEDVGDENDEGNDEEEEDMMWEVRWTPNSTPLMTLNRRLQDIQEGDGALGMALEDVDNEADHGGNCYFVRGDHFTDPFMVVLIHINHEEEPDRV
jgi:hypothetical protein